MVTHATTSGISRPSSGELMVSWLIAAEKPRAATASLRRAVEIATAQGAGWLELRALHSLASRFPDQAVREQLADLVETLPSGHDLPAFRAATDLLSESG